jgi:hypothetical protein
MSFPLSNIEIVMSESDQGVTFGRSGNNDIFPRKSFIPALSHSDISSIIRSKREGAASGRFGDSSEKHANDKRITSG